MFIVVFQSFIPYKLTTQETLALDSQETQIHASFFVYKNTIEQK